MIIDDKIQFLKLLVVSVPILFLLRCNSVFSLSPTVSPAPLVLSSSLTISPAPLCSLPLFHFFAPLCPFMSCTCGSTPSARESCSSWLDKDSPLHFHVQAQGNEKVLSARLENWATEPITFGYTFTGTQYVFNLRNSFFKVGRTLILDVEADGNFQNRHQLHSAVTSDYFQPIRYVSVHPWN